MEIQVSTGRNNNPLVSYENLTPGVWVSTSEETAAGSYIIVTEKEQFFINDGKLETLDESLWYNDSFRLADAPLTVTFRN